MKSEKSVGFFYEFGSPLIVFLLNDPGKFSYGTFCQNVPKKLNDRLKTTSGSAVLGWLKDDQISLENVTKIIEKHTDKSKILDLFCTNIASRSTP